MNIGIILANGQGDRFDSNVPKQFHKILGKMVINYVIDALSQAKSIDKIIIVTNTTKFRAYLLELSKYEDVDIINGGETRNATLSNSLSYIHDNYECENVVICDAVRPLIKEKLIDEYINLLNDSYDCVVTSSKITDELCSKSREYLNRDDYFLLQSPEAYKFNLLYKYFDKDSSYSEVLYHLPKNKKCYFFFNSGDNIKLTYQTDIRCIEAVLLQRNSNINFSVLLSSIKKLKSYLQKNYYEQIDNWLEHLQEAIPSLFLKWSITSYEVVCTSRFGIVFLSQSANYGDCVIKIVPPFINRYDNEKDCYLNLSSDYMCELIDFDNSSSVLLLRRCGEVDLNIENEYRAELVSFFSNVKSNTIETRNNSNAIHFHDYQVILNKKLDYVNTYKPKQIFTLLNRALDLYEALIKRSELCYIHGDLHRFNVLLFNDKLVAIDPIGYIAPFEIEITRYLGTELIQNNVTSADKLVEYISFFSDICDTRDLTITLFVDCVFRMHNSLFEEIDHVLTDKWLNLIKLIESIL